MKIEDALYDDDNHPITREEAIEMFMRELECTRELALIFIERLLRENPGHDFVEGH